MYSSFLSVYSSFRLLVVYMCVQEWFATLTFFRTQPAVSSLESAMVAATKLDDACPPPPPFCCSVSLVPPSITTYAPFLSRPAQVIGQARNDRRSVEQEEASSSSSFGSNIIKEQQQKHFKAHTSSTSPAPPSTR